MVGSGMPLPLTNSWPLFEADQWLDLGLDLDWQAAALNLSAADGKELARRGIGVWECDLEDDKLTWSDGVYDIFGLPRGVRLTRSYAVACYAERSRATMERLRAYAIKHRRGFVLDAEIVPASGPRRWMRLLAAPHYVHGRPVQIRGVKRDLTERYR